jgi:membrane-associated phospholipid phosphatase
VGKTVHMRADITTDRRPARRWARGAGSPDQRQAASRSQPLHREIASAARRLWLPAAALTIGMVLLGLLVSHVLAHGWLGREDTTIDRELAGSRTPTGNTITAVFTTLASTPVVVGITAVAAIAFRVAFGRWRESVYLVLCTAGETTIFVLTTLVVDRARPPVPHLDDAPPTSSFPSGHTAATLCCWGAIAAVLLWRYRQPVLRALMVAIAVLLPLLVGASRLYRGMHFPTDVLAGLLLGATWLAATTRWYRHSP